ncbi:MAG: signal peptidase I [Peptococcaceae bacterium]|nr:signal peptidase I [Peptococcaceae bacterium]
MQAAIFSQNIEEWKVKPLSEKETGRVMGVFKDYILPVVIALAIVIVLRMFVLGMYYVPSGSMIPTLQINDKVVVTKLSYKMHEPERGDVVVFKYPPNEEQGLPEKDYVKRLIGLPGEKLEIKNNTVYINDMPVEEPYVNSNTNMPDYGPITIPEGEYFMMGDNRNDSSDSRVWGFVPEEYLIGKAQLIYWPLAHVGRLD